MRPIKRFAFLVVPLAFLSVMCFFQINSAWADENNFNTGWKVAGVVIGVLAIWQLILVARDAGGGRTQ
jgi:hypothetical protein